METMQRWLDRRSLGVYWMAARKPKTEISDTCIPRDSNTGILDEILSNLEPDLSA